MQVLSPLVLAVLVALYILVQIDRARFNNDWYPIAKAFGWLGPLFYYVWLLIVPDSPYRVFWGRYSQAFLLITHLFFLLAKTILERRQARDEANNANS